MPDLTADEIVRAIGPRTALIEFIVAADTTWALVVAPGPDGRARISAFDLQISRAHIEHGVTAFRAQLASRDLAFRGNAQRLYADLLAPAARALQGFARVVIVPDGPLWRLPFQALVRPSGRYVIEDTTIAYTPSAAALLHLSARRAGRAGAQAPPRLVAFGDPAGASPAGGGARLPNAAREVRTLAALYGAAQARAFEAGAATEARFRAEAPRASVLHVATHGVIDDQNPMYSYVSLGATGEGEDLDGRIEAREMRGLGLQADLAVLSACETALGRIHAGEGMVGLSWALFAAGASAVAVSQWPVDSASTTELMIAFHGQMRTMTGRGRGLQPAESLRQAAIATMRDARYRHPFYWAGFLVMGDAW
jgi:CHAT domain-containing protein